MSKAIRMTPQLVEECRAEFEEVLRSAKLLDGKLSYSKSFPQQTDRKAVISFTPEAWAKTVLLVRAIDKEVAWHGVAERLENDEYLISDIMVYPQEVTGATVDMDKEGYEQWLCDNAEDERFYKIRMQGHSHVNMGTTPSAVDLEHQREILERIREDGFYIFMIWNKSFSINSRIYDLRENVYFENTDITVRVVGQDGSLDDFVRDAKDMVRTKVYAAPKKTTPAVYTGQQQTSAKPPETPITPAKPQQLPAAAQKPAEKPKTTIGAGWKGKDAQKDYDYFDDHHDYYGGWGYR